MATRTCPICGEKFEVKTYNQRYCSDKCSQFMHGHKYKATCKSCGKVAYSRDKKTLSRRMCLCGSSRLVTKTSMYEIYELANSNTTTPIQQEFIDLYNANHGHEVYNQENVKEVSAVDMFTYLDNNKALIVNNTNNTSNTQELETKVVELENKVEVLTNTINKLNENFTNYMRAKENVMKLLTF